MKKKPKNASPRVKKLVGEAPSSTDEYGPKIPTLLESVDIRNLRQHNILAESFEAGDLNDLSKVILQFSKSAELKARDTVHTAALSILDAWLCGCALNLAKNKLKHGDFKNWFQSQCSKKAWGHSPLSLRTAQRYMQLARNFTTAEDVLNSSPTLRQAYLICGALPAPLETDNPEVSDREAVARTRLLKSVTSIQKRLRQFADKKISIDKGTRKELLGAKKEIDRLFASLCG